MGKLTSGWRLHVITSVFISIALEDSTSKWSGAPRGHDYAANNWNNDFSRPDAGRVYGGVV